MVTPGKDHHSEWYFQFRQNLHRQGIAEHPGRTIPRSRDRQVHLDDAAALPGASPVG